MKKSIFLLAACTALTLASCGNKTSEPAAPVDSAAVAAEPETAAAVTDVLESALQGETPDAEKVKTAMNEAAETIQRLKDEGKLDEAAAYASKVKEFVDAHADDIKKYAPESATVIDLVNAVGNLPESVKAAAQEGAAAVKSDAAAAKEAAKEAGKQATDKAKADAAAAADKAKADAAAAVEAGKQEARDKAHQAIDKGLNKLLGK